MVWDCVSVFQGDRQVDTGDGAGSRGFCGHLHSDSRQTATRNPTTGEWCKQSTGLHGYILSKYHSIPTCSLKKNSEFCNWLFDIVPAAQTKSTTTKRYTSTRKGCKFNAFLGRGWWLSWQTYYCHSLATTDSVGVFELLTPHLCAANLIIERKGSKFVCKGLWCHWESACLLADAWCSGSLREDISSLKVKAQNSLSEYPDGILRVCTFAGRCLIMVCSFSLWELWPSSKVLG